MTLTTPGAQATSSGALADFAWSRRGLLALTGFVAAAAFGGGVALMVWPDGGGWLPGRWVLTNTSFLSFVTPGVLLVLLVGVPNVVAFGAQWRRGPGANAAALVAGLLLAGWIAGEVAIIQAPSVLEGFFVVVAVKIVALAAWRRRAMHSVR